MRMDARKRMEGSVGRGDVYGDWNRRFSPAVMAAPASNWGSLRALFEWGMEGNGRGRGGLQIGGAGVAFLCLNAGIEEGIHGGLWP